MKFLDRLPFLPEHQGKRELVFVIVLFVTIAGLGLIGGLTGVLYKDVPQSTPTAIVTTVTPDAAATPTP
jgi:hypothetical protein